MANNYCQTSTFYPIDIASEEVVLDTIEKATIEFARDMGDLIEGDSGEDVSPYGYIDWEIEKEEGLEKEDDKAGIWFHADESGNMDALARIISRLQITLHATKPFTFTYSYTCSRMRLDEFGGGSYAVMPDGRIFHSGSEYDALLKAGAL